MVSPADRIRSGTSGLWWRLLVVAAVAPAACAAVVVVDDFSTPVGGQTITGSGLGSYSSIYTLGGPGLLGGSRIMTIAISADAGSIANASANGSIVDRLIYENGAGIHSTLTLAYNANGAGLAQNWGGLDNLIFLASSTDSAATVHIELFTDSSFGSLSQATGVLTIPAHSAGNNTFSFASLTSSGGFNLSSINSVRFTIEGPDGYDLSLQRTLATAPESQAGISAGCVLAMGLGLGLLRRYRASTVKPIVSNS